MATVTALSIQQPWAWLIVNGYKDIENRNWNIKYRGELHVHVGKKIEEDGIDWVKFMFPQIVLPSAFDTGGIVGKTTIVDCVTRSNSPWFFGKYGFVLKKSQPVAFVKVSGPLIVVVALRVVVAETSKSPFTDNLAVGEAVPTPTLPPVVRRITIAPFDQSESPDPARPPQYAPP